MSDLTSLLLGGSIVGIGGGLSLLVRGFAAYGRADRVADTATSRIATLAVGEVRVTGQVEAAELTLVSPVQSRSCVYYRARIRAHEGRSSRTVLAEERAVGFRVRDDSGAIRVFPRDGAWDVPSCYHDTDGVTGDQPPGVSMRDGPAIQAASPDRAALVADLLTVRPSLGSSGLLISADGQLLGFSDPVAAGSSAGRRDYEEARIEPGDTVTIVGTALPYDQLPDPSGADLAESEAIGGPLAATADPEIAADLDAARAAGTLETDPDAAWGNAAIPGFGIDRPIRAPELDPAARAPAVADPPTAERFSRTFAIAPGELVLAVEPGRPLLISLGAPAAVVGRDQDSFVRGLLGAVLAIGSAITLALVLGGVVS